MTAAAAAAAKSHQSCPTQCNPIDGSPPGSPVPGILQARTLEWVAISFSNAWKWKVKGKSLSRVWLFETPWTAAYQAPPSMEFSRQEYWSGMPLPSPCCTAETSRTIVKQLSSNKKKKKESSHEETVKLVSRWCSPSGLSAARSWPLLTASLALQTISENSNVGKEPFCKHDG